MKAQAIIAAIICFIASTVVAQLPRHISRRDEADIRAAVHAVAREPILRIEAMIESRPVPGSVPEEGTEGRIEHGKVVMRARVFYVRTDRFTVSTGSEANLTGPAYLVQRVGSGWKVTKASFWIH